MAIIGIGTFIQMFALPGDDADSKVVDGVTSPHNFSAAKTFGTTGFGTLPAEDASNVDYTFVIGGVTVGTVGSKTIRGLDEAASASEALTSLTISGAGVAGGTAGSKVFVLPNQVDGVWYFVGYHGNSLLVGAYTVAGRESLVIRTGATGYLPIAEINGFQGPSFSKEEVDITTLDSVGGFRKFITTLKDAGQATMEMNFTRDSYRLMGGLYKKVGTAAMRSWAVTLNDDPTGAQGTNRFSLWFRASVLSIPMNIPLADKITQTATLRLSGEPLDGFVDNIYRVVPKRQEGTEAAQSGVAGDTEFGRFSRVRGNFSATNLVAIDD